MTPTPIPFWIKTYLATIALCVAIWAVWRLV